MESVQSKERVICYIDGLNIYHATRNRPSEQTQTSARINFMSLVQSLLRENQTLERIYYFAAYAEWRKEDCKKHQAYVAQLEKSGVRIDMSYFSTAPQREEKETDVKIALEIYGDAFKNLYDKAFIFSGDRDLIPAIKKVKKEFPQKRLVVVLPNRVWDNSRDIRKHTEKNKRLRKGTINAHLFPAHLFPKPKKPKKSD